ncbi:Cobalt/zinc/cadmium efflux RND transporter, membrane fusion protein, CzcB family [hydrothermal vent metagenome]|uniref:Cobalt/zinc/cadmium efflux RND transporter, membrane fusion protein, CzcB family n=1 Tax=hydrothermal vent metagenome TaxID=652676 RepID=A0A3B0X597_9ZZZZ
MSKKILLFALLTGLMGFYFGQLTGGTASVEFEKLTDENHTQYSDKSEGTHYVCPMHAEIIAEEVQSCPICGMDLVRKKTDLSAKNTGGAFPVVEISPYVAHNLAVRTAVVRRGELKRSIETIGKVTRVDPMARRTITPPIRGELLYIAEKYQGDMVERGELLFSMTSQRLLEMQVTYQTAFRSGDKATATSMIPALRKMGLSPEQISELQAGKKAMPVEVYAFEDGFVYTRRGREGESVHTGFTVFNVGGNYQVIEVTAEIFERQWSWVEQGQSATMTVRGLPGEFFKGKVVRVEPPVGYTTRSLEIALKFRTDNTELSQSMFAHISIEGRAKKNILLVPTDTVIKTGQGDRVVKLQGENKFQPVKVIAGEEANGFTEIREGLKENDKVVASGQFLIDSESNLQAELSRMKPTEEYQSYEVKAVHEGLDHKVKAPAKSKQVTFVTENEVLKD